MLAAALACLALVLLAVVVYARRGDEERSFACACVAIVVASPIIWLHSFALLLGAGGPAQAAAVAGLVPARGPGLVSKGTGNGAPWQTAVTMAVAALFVIVVLAPPRPTNAVWRARLGLRPS